MFGRSWDDKPINGGKVHENCLVFDRLIHNDMRNVADTTQLVPIPYGYVTGMRSQLT